MVVWSHSMRQAFRRSFTSSASVTGATSKGKWLPDYLRFPTRMKNYLLSRSSIPHGVKNLIGHPAGPFTIHFWAPAWKWGLVAAGIADLKKPAENISRPQSTALGVTGVIWCRYATQIIPVNYNLLSVNIFVAATGLFQLYRSYSWENEQKQKQLQLSAPTKQ